MKKAVVGLLAVVVLIMTLMSLPDKDTVEATSAYKEEIEKERTKKDEDFVTEDWSPLEDEDKSTFHGLHYFAVNPVFKVEASLEWMGFKQAFIVNTTQGKSRRYLKSAVAKFELEGKEIYLTLLKPQLAQKGMENVYTLAFTDETSGRTSYGAGRYLELELETGSLSTTIDFNKAFNPYCAYNKKFDCVIPPSENHIAVAIDAGEKTYPH